MNSQSVKSKVPQFLSTRPVSLAEIQTEPAQDPQLMKLLPLLISGDKEGVKADSTISQLYQVFEGQLKKNAKKFNEESYVTNGEIGIIPDGDELGMLVY